MRAQDTPTGPTARSLRFCSLDANKLKLPGYRVYMQPTLKGCEQISGIRARFVPSFTPSNSAFLKKTNNRKDVINNLIIEIKDSASTAVRAEIPNLDPVGH